MEIFLENLRRYLQDRHTDYALHLDGPWGTGKTHFIKNEVFKMFEQDPEHPKNPFSDYKIVYVSLNGIKSVDEIGESIFFQLMEPKGEKLYRFTRGSVNLLKNFRIYGISFEPNQKGMDAKAQEQIINNNLENMVLFLDDLERIDDELSIKSVLGFINTNFVEHNQVKTVFISDSDKIEDKLDFDNVKEKLIGRTVNFRPDKRKAIYSIIDNEYSNLYHYFNQDMETVITMLASLEPFNLRTIRFVCNITDSVLYSINSMKLSNEKLISIFTCILVNGIEFKNGNIASLDDAYANLNPHNLFNRKKSNAAHQNLQNTLIDDVLIRNNFVYFESLSDFVINGHFSLRKLSNELEEIYKEPNPEDISFSVVESYYDHEIDEVNQRFHETVKAAEEGKYKALKFPYIYINLEEIVDKGYVECDKKQLIISLKNGLEHALQQDASELTEEKKHILERKISFPESEGCISLTNMIYNKIDEVNQQRQLERSEDLVYSIANSDFTMIKKHIEALRVAKDFFEIMNKRYLYNELPTMSNDAIRNFSSVIREIYTNTPTTLNEVELLSAEQFRKELKISLENVQPDRLKSDLLDEILNEVYYIYKHYKNTEQ